MNDVVLSLAEKREAVAEAQRLYAEALAYDQSPYEGYCFHGTYVGGCGIDWMCGYCESSELGSSHYDYLSGSFRYSVALRRIKGQIRLSRIEAWMANLSAKGLKGSQIMEVAEKQLSDWEIQLVSTLAWQAHKAEFAN
jgi:hypothetical protein